ncbi:MAG: alpha-galactosidase, partial [Acidobacteriota bacterium]|nr:alpha-galactosidase [Acidobacteriota bacterium]
WDNWSQILQQFDFARDWAQFGGPNHWPDADMLPLGRIRVRGYRDRSPCKLTHDEQITMMTLWSIFRSPLMMGGDLPSLDPFTLSLLTNPEVLAVDQHSVGGREILRPQNAIIWEARDPASGAKYVAFFNTGTAPRRIAVTWRRLGINRKAGVRDLWRRKDLGNYNGEFEATINPHGAGFYKLTTADESK